MRLRNSAINLVENGISLFEHFLSLVLLLKRAAIRVNTHGVCVFDGLEHEVRTVIIKTDPLVKVDGLWRTVKWPASAPAIGWFCGPQRGWTGDPLLAA